jgi:hypothetical protein
MEIPLTVKRLIEELQKFDENLEVRIADWQEGACSPTPLYAKDIKIEDAYARKYNQGKPFLKLGDDE